jgi:flagellar basal-body rod modification protein FlgD
MTSSVIGSTSTSVSTTPTDTMGSSSGTTSAADLQSTFLTLFVTQLQNQNPTNPVDSSQMTSQLAQIDTVTGISQLNTSLTSLSAQLTAGQEMQAASLIGTDVLAPGSSVTVSGGTASSFGVQLSSAVSSLTLTVKNAAGQVVDTINEGAQSAGVVPLTWNGTDTAGNQVADGTYTISASYPNSSGGQSAATTLTAAQVDGVTQQASGAPALVLSNGSTASLSQIASIALPSTSSTSTASSTSSTGSSTTSN